MTLAIPFLLLVCDVLLLILPQIADWYEVDGVPIIAVQFQHAKVEPDAPSKSNPTIPSQLEKAILTAMAKDRASRHTDVRVFLTALQALQKSAQEWTKEGNAHYYQKRYTEALAAYDQAIRLNPNYADYYNGKGVALCNLQRYTEALAAIEQALRLDPNDANYYNGKGLALYNLQRYTEALAAYEQALRLNPNNAIAYQSKGVTLDQLGRKREAQQAYEKARQLGYKG